MARVFVAQNRNSIHIAASVKVRLEFFGRRTVVNIANVDATIVYFDLLFHSQRAHRSATSYKHVL
jgi:hypothetical protein